MRQGIDPVSETGGPAGPTDPVYFHPLALCALTFSATPIKVIGPSTTQPTSDSSHQTTPENATVTLSLETLTIAATSDRYKALTLPASAYEARKAGLHRCLKNHALI